MQDGVKLPSVLLLKQYIKNLSFTNSVDPLLNLQSDQDKPQISVNLTATAKEVADAFEVTISLQAKASLKTLQIFNLNIDYSAIFKLDDVDEVDLEPMLLIYCPSIIFPFLRRIVADVTRDSSLPPLMLELVDFAKIYHEGKKDLQ